ncbi:MAG TPA: hypothetical protein ENN65_01625 [Candidatus Hydrogenedentes bacterium]|nr:hypothetical protein [Candidatus Hydrogenedentota bacterium]
MPVNVNMFAGGWVGGAAAHHIDREGPLGPFRKDGGDIPVPVHGVGQLAAEHIDPVQISLPFEEIPPRIGIERLDKDESPFLKKIGARSRIQTADAFLEEPEPVLGFFLLGGVMRHGERCEGDNGRAKARMSACYFHSVTPVRREGNQ